MRTPAHTRRRPIVVTSERRLQSVEEDKASTQWHDSKAKQLQHGRTVPGCVPERGKVQPHIPPSESGPCNTRRGDHLVTLRLKRSQQKVISTNDAGEQNRSPCVPIQNTIDSTHFPHPWERRKERRKGGRGVGIWGRRDDSRVGKRIKVCLKEGFETNRFIESRRY